MTTADITQIIAAVGSVLTGLLVVAGGFWLQSLAKKVATTEELTVLGDKKLNKVIATATETLGHVNGPTSSMLAELAVVKAEVAKLTGSNVDFARAVEAQEKSAEHTAHSESVSASADAATAATQDLADATREQAQAIEERAKRRT